MTPEQFPCDGVVTEERARLLMAQEAESPSLDYKRTCDLSTSAGRAEFIKDSAAMMSRPEGGYLLIGVDGAGKVAHESLDSSRFDESRLRPLLESVLGNGIVITSQVHRIDEGDVAVIFLGRRADGLFPVAMKDVVVQAEDGKARFVVRHGDVFVRDGTSSSRWSTQQLPELLRPWEERIRREERNRLGELLAEAQTASRGQLIADGPAAGLTWELSPEDFENAFTEAIRKQDDVIIQLSVMNAKAAGLAFRTSATPPDDLEFTQLLDRLTDSLALGVAFDRSSLVQDATKALHAIYLGGSAEVLNPSALDSRIWLAIATRVLGAAALAVRLQRWQYIRTLVLRRVDDYWDNWMRHALTWANRHETMNPEGGQSPTGAFVALARQRVQAVPGLRIDARSASEPAGVNEPPLEVDPLLDSVCQADFLACVVIATEHGNFYPSFAGYYQHRTRAAFAALADARVLELLLPGASQAEVQDALDRVEGSASKASLYSL
jgi:hypothetical protein